MIYADMRAAAKTGDILLVRGNKLVRIFTAGSYSHVAMLVWMPGEGGLWVFEFIETCGFRSIPASQWFDLYRGKQVFFGTAPGWVRARPEDLTATALKYRSGNPVKRLYGWLSFPLIWVSQLTGWRLPVMTRVCSTFVQECWEATGYTGLANTADPEDFSMVVRTLAPVGDAE